MFIKFHRNLLYRNILFLSLSCFYQQTAFSQTFNLVCKIQYSEKIAEYVNDVPNMDNFIDFYNKKVEECVQKEMESHPDLDRSIERSSSQVLCRSTIRTYHYNYKFNYSDYTRIYRIDLRRKRYCIDKCKESIELKGYDQKYINFFSYGLSKEYIDRETGFYFFNKIEDLNEYSSFGYCRKAKFTGMPLRKF